jgi:geranylgeranyl reductase family protein
VSSTTLDAVIVGAGPAGAAAAIAAARARLDVVVLDKAELGRDKTCGDGLTTDALRILEELGVTDPTLEPSAVEVHGSVLVGPSGRVIELPLPEGDGRHAAVIARAELDARLAQTVLDLGVTVRMGEAVTAMHEHADALEVVCASGARLRARHVIAADGHWSPVRRMLRPDAPRATREWHAARQYFSDAGDGRLWVLFERDLLPGYAWVFPMAGGRVNVGFGVLRGNGMHGKELARLWAGLCERPTMRSILGPAARAEGSVRTWPIPGGFDPDALTIGRVLFVGDAGRLADPLTGEGIAQALHSGMLAARAIAVGRDVAATYRRTVSRELGVDLRFAAALQVLLERPGVARAALALVDTNDWTRRNFARWMWEDYPRGILLTPRRWSRGMLSGPGAYRDTVGASA